jgi:hexosaminidase
MMTHKITILIAALISAGLFSCKKNETDLAHENLIPLPVSVHPTGGSFELTSKTVIYVQGSGEVTDIAHYLAGKLSPATGFELPVTEGKESDEDGNIVLVIDHSDNALGAEGYKLTITDEKITLSANQPAGLFHGAQTLRQLLPPSIESSSRQSGPWKIATGEIRDLPTYAWRGTMLDVARHFFSVEDVKRYIDLASTYKLNIMHLHLSDDQGWRIEIKSWPNLTSIGGQTQVGGGKGGFYTQEQYKDIVAYAAKHYMTIVPEIDLPGHINSALASYGDLNGGTIVPVEGRVKSVLNTPATALGRKNKSKPTELYSGISVGWSTLRVEKEITFKFINDVIREIASITPGPYIHIGGDEAAATKKEDYIVFINRFKDIVKSHGKKMVGWEEIAQADINQDILTQYWHSSKFSLAASEKGSKIIMSPSKKAYMDMQYDATSPLGLHWAAYIEVDSAYKWDPAKLVIGLSRENIIGLEAPLWSETVVTMDDIEYLAFPRLPGYAEIGWSDPAAHNWDEYKVRLGKHASRLKALDINFYRSKRVPWSD